MKEINEKELKEAKAKLTCSIDAPIIDKHGKEVKLTELTTAGG